MKQLSQLGATTRDCPYNSSRYVGAILYGCPNYFMHVPKYLIELPENKIIRFF